jgi:hypothetical protein
MELSELQAIWQQHDKNLIENTKINKEVLKRILISKPEKRLNREKINAVFNLILPIALILLILVPNIHYRPTIEFYTGIFLFGAVSSALYYWSVRYYILIDRIDFSNSVTMIKKNIKQLEKYKIKLKRFGYLLMPFGIIGIFLMCKFPFFSINSILPFSIIIAVMIASIYFTFKYSIYKQFRLLNKEIEELEKLEIE